MTQYYLSAPYIRCFLASVTVLVTTLAAPVFAQSSGYTPGSNVPQTAATASAPITVPLNRKIVDHISDDDTVPSPEPFTYTLTAIDKDTWMVVGTVGNEQQVVDPYITCAEAVKEYPDVTAPAYRGTATDGSGTKIWDVVGQGKVIWTPRVTPAVQQRTVYNRYIFGNNPQLPGGRNPVLNDEDVIATQCLILKGYE